MGDGYRPAKTRRGKGQRLYMGLGFRPERGGYVGDYIGEYFAGY